MIEWNGLPFENIEALAAYLNVEYAITWKWLNRGYICDADIGKAFHSVKPIPLSVEERRERNRQKAKESYWRKKPQASVIEYAPTDKLKHELPKRLLEPKVKRMKAKIRPTAKNPSPAQRLSKLPPTETSKEAMHLFVQTRHIMTMQEWEAEIEKDRRDAKGGFYEGYERKED